MHDFFIKFLVCFAAGTVAGIGTGLSGLSAAALISPILITCLGMDPGMSLGIALASDILASSVSAHTYAKNGNVDLKKGKIMVIASLIFTVLGSYVGTHIPHNTMGSFSLIMMTVRGIRFICKPTVAIKEADAEPSRWVKVAQSILCGCVIGFVCGFVGPGGGMLRLWLLTNILGYELKTAVGTGTFIMVFTAFVGANSHFMLLETTVDLGALFWCILFTFIWARISSRFANKANPVTLNRVTGFALTVLGILMFTVKGFI